MRVKNVVFDLDGTLIDTSIGIFESIRHTVNVMNFPELSEKKFMTFIGPPLWKSFMDHCGCSENQAQEATRVFRDYYQNGAVLHAKLYQGIYDLCLKLDSHGVKMGVATNKPQRFAVDLIKYFGLDTYCSPVFGADDGGKLSKTDLIQQCMKEMKANKSDTVLIGDTDNDAIGAEQVGISFIAVAYGFGFGPHTSNLKYPCIGIADSPMQIADILMNIDKATINNSKTH